VEKGSSLDLQEAGRLIQKAARFSDRRFGWWRTVKEELERKVNVGVPKKMKAVRRIG